MRLIPSEARLYPRSIDIFLRRRRRQPEVGLKTVDVSGRRYVCTSTEESSSPRASASLRVKTSLCPRAIVLKDEETPDGKVTYRYVKVI